MQVLPSLAAGQLKKFVPLNILETPTFNAWQIIHFLRIVSSPRQEAHGPHIIQMMALIKRLCFGTEEKGKLRNTLREEAYIMSNPQISWEELPSLLQQTDQQH